LVEELTLTLAAQRLNARCERTNAASQVALRTRTAVEAWLKNRPGGTTIEDWVGPDPKPAKSEDIITTVSRLERRTRELRADLHRVESAPFPSSYGKERMREIWWPMRTLQSTVHNAEGPRPVAFAETEQVIPMLAWLFGDLMVKGPTP
jgi:hypothetical protein